MEKTNHDYFLKRDGQVIDRDQETGTRIEIHKLKDNLPKYSAPPPVDWSSYTRTGNNAIDLVAQRIGFARAKRERIREIHLKPTSYDLFFAGIEALQGRQIDPITELAFDGILIRKGQWRQFETLKVVYAGSPLV